MLSINQHYVAFLGCNVSRTLSLFIKEILCEDNMYCGFTNYVRVFRSDGDLFSLSGE